MASSSTGGCGESFDGVIHGKFEGGYVITLTMGSEELKGVLYEPSQNPVLPSSINSNGSVSSSFQRRRRRKKSEKKKRKRDPALPKPTRSGYNFFFAEKHAEVKQQYQETHYREISKLVGELWNKLQESDKMVRNLFHFVFYTTMSKILVSPFEYIFLFYDGLNLKGFN